MPAVLLLRRIAYTLLTLFRPVTLRSDDQHMMRWRALAHLGTGRAHRSHLRDDCPPALSRGRYRRAMREVTPREIRAAQQGTRPRNPAVPAARAAQPESPGLQAGEDVKSPRERVRPAHRGSARGAVSRRRRAVDGDLRRSAGQSWTPTTSCSARVAVRLARRIQLGLRSASRKRRACSGVQRTFSRGVPRAHARRAALACAFIKPRAGPAHEIECPPR